MSKSVIVRRRRAHRLLMKRVMAWQQQRKEGMRQRVVDSFASPFARSLAWRSLSLSQDVRVNPRQECHRFFGTRSRSLHTAPASCRRVNRVWSGGLK